MTVTVLLSVCYCVSLLLCVTVSDIELLYICYCVTRIVVQFSCYSEYITVLLCACYCIAACALPCYYESVMSLLLCLLLSLSYSGLMCKCLCVTGTMSQ